MNLFSLVLIIKKYIKLYPEVHFNSEIRLLTKIFSNVWSYIISHLLF